MEPSNFWGGRTCLYEAIPMKPQIARICFLVASIEQMGGAHCLRRKETIQPPLGFHGSETSRMTPVQAETNAWMAF